MFARDDGVKGRQEINMPGFGTDAALAASSPRRTLQVYLNLIRLTIDQSINRNPDPCSVSARHRDYSRMCVVTSRYRGAQMDDNPAAEKNEL